MELRNGVESREVGTSRILRLPNERSETQGRSRTMRIKCSPNIRALKNVFLFESWDMGEKQYFKKCFFSPPDTYAQSSFSADSVKSIYKT